jgi:hypothetical protein
MSAGENQFSLIRASVNHRRRGKKANPYEAKSVNSED